MGIKGKGDRKTATEIEKIERGKKGAREVKRDRERARERKRDRK